MIENIRHSNFKERFVYVHETPENARRRDRDYDAVIIHAEEMASGELKELIDEFRKRSQRPLIIVAYRFGEEPEGAKGADWLISTGVGNRETLARLVSQIRDRSFRKETSEEERPIALVSPKPSPKMERFLTNIGFTVKPLQEYKEETEEKVIAVFFDSAYGKENKEIIRYLHEKGKKVMALGRGTIVGVMGYVEYYAENILAQGVDFFIELGTAEVHFIRSAYDVLKAGGSVAKVMYEYVGNSELDNRAKITANTKEEVLFLKKLFKKQNCKRIYDAGCGNGRLTIPLAQAGFEMSGGDISKTLLEAAQQRHPELKIDYQQVDLLKLDLPPESFDAIIMMWHVISEFTLEEQLKIYKSAWKALKNPQTKRRWFRKKELGGLLVFDFQDISTMAEGYGRSIGGRFNYHGNNVDTKNLPTQLRDADFHLLKLEEVEWGIHKHVVVAQKGWWH